MARKDEKVAQIITAATQEFLKKGIDAASMHNIAETAGVSKRTLYKYFCNKDVLYSALIDELLDSVSDMYPFEYCTDTPIRQQLEHIVEHKIQITLSASFLNMSKIVIGEILKSRQPSEQQMERMYNSEVMFVHWINAAKQDKTIASSMESQMMAEQFHAILKGQIFFPVILHFVDVNSIDLQAVKKRTVDFFMHAFCDG